jgi:hypothetical protein
MALKINNTSLVTNHYLVVESDGVRYCETSFAGGTRRFRFSDIECILISPSHTLSFQVGKEVFSIPTRADNAKHQETIGALVNEVRRAGEAWAERS